MKETPNWAAGRILAVIVLYKMLPRDSDTYKTLAESMRQAPRCSVEIMFYDNTPGGQQPENLPHGVRYESEGKNRGIAVAYNRALEIATAEGFDWLLTLDQDTKLPSDFVVKLEDAVSVAKPMAQVGAVVPMISDGGRVVSPNALSFSLFPKFFPSGFTGVAEGRTASAVNSASTVRVSALREIGGYDSRFCLDYSDAVMYHRLHKRGYRIYVAGNIQVKHELSVLDMKNRVSYERYEDILGAESAFWDECMGWIAGPALLLRYSYRVFYKFWRTGGTSPYVRISARFLWRRATWSRERRMELWQQSVRRRFSL